MKTKLMCLFLCALMLLTLASCGGEDAESSVIEDSSEEESVIEIKEPKINGVALSEFAVVYKSTADCATYKKVAKDFVEYVQETFGYKLACRDETIPKSDKEILIGYVSKRDICTENTAEFGYGGYKIVIKGTTVLIAGSYATGCNAGVSALKQKFAESETGEFTDTVIEGEKKIIKVACVGDSITQGINSSDPKTQTYPAYIQEMLGYDYYVMNAGLSGYSICDIDVYAYYKSRQFAESRDMRPDVVLFALGTNDANPTPTQPYKNWDDPQYDRTNVFIKSTNDLLNAYKRANPDVQIYIILPASLFKVGADGWDAEAWTANIVKHSHPLLVQIAKDNNLPTIDMFPWSLEHKEVFTDGLHPKNETYKTFAQYIYDSVKDTIKKPE